MSKKARARQRTSLPADGVVSINAIAERLNIPDWDVLLIGDGSGCGWSIGAGWACSLIDRASRATKLFFGAANTGTVSIAELWPYIYALLWYISDDGPGKQRLKDVNTQGRNVNIHIVTDSQYVASAGNNPEYRHAHLPLWAATDAVAKMGYNLRWHHMAREVLNLNIFVDQLSKCARLSMDTVMVQTSAELGKQFPGLPPDLSIYDFLG